MDKIKNRKIYSICKVVNVLIYFIVCVVWIFSLSSGKDDITGYISIISLAYTAFIMLRRWYKNSRSRWLYQIWIFLGYIYAEYCMFFPTKEEFLENGNLVVGSIEASIYHKIILTLLVIIALGSKLYTMYYETDDYRADAIWRRSNRLDEEIYKATYELEGARSTLERQKAYAKLQRAKVDKSYFENWIK